MSSPLPLQNTSSFCFCCPRSALHPNLTLEKSRPIEILWGSPEAQIDPAVSRVLTGQEAQSPIDRRRTQAEISQRRAFYHTVHRQLFGYRLIATFTPPSSAASNCLFSFLSIKLQFNSVQVNSITALCFQDLSDWAALSFKSS